MFGCGVEQMRVMEMNVRVILNVFSFWVIGDVEELIVVVASICDSMRVVAVLPNLSGEVVANGEGKASLDQLDATLDGVIVGWRNQNVNVFRHNDEAVESKAALFAVAKERIHHKVGVCGALKDATALMGDRSDGEGFGFNANALRGIGGHISGAKARFVCRFKCPG
jgi:hypothetical protein